MHVKIILALTIGTSLSGCVTRAAPVTDAALCLRLNYIALNETPAAGVTLVEVEQPPNILKLLNVPHPAFIPKYGHKIVKATVPVDKLYEGANWVEDGGTIEIDWGTGLGGVMVKLRQTGDMDYIGSATAYTDVPDPTMRFQEFHVQANRVACDRARSNNSFKPKPLRGSA